MKNTVVKNTKEKAKNETDDITFKPIILTKCY